MDGTGNITTSAAASKNGAALDAKGKARLQKAVKDFEAIFMGMMMKSMRSSVPKDDTGESFGNDVMESLFDDEVAKHMAGKSNLGLADMLYRSITNEPLPAQGSSHAATPGSGAPVALSPAPASAAAPSPAPASVAPARPSPARPAQEGASAVAPPTPGAGTSRTPSKAGAWVASPSASTLDRIASYENIIQEAAQAHGVDSTMLKAVIAAESAGNRNAVSSKDAKGLMQLTDTTAADMGVKNVWNPRDNIQGGAKYLQSLIQRFPGDTKSVIASYNAGPGRVEKLGGGVPPIPETQAYVRRVMNYMDFFEQKEASDEGR